MPPFPGSGSLETQHAYPGLGRRNPAALADPLICPLRLLHGLEAAEGTLRLLAWPYALTGGDAGVTPVEGGARRPPEPAQLALLDATLLDRLFASLSG